MKIKTGKEEALDRLPGVVEQLQDNGYALKDIAILVRTNMEGAMVAEKLLSYKGGKPFRPLSLRHNLRRRPVCQRIAGCSFYGCPVTVSEKSGR